MSGKRKRKMERNESFLWIVKYKYILVDIEYISGKLTSLNLELFSRYLVLISHCWLLKRLLVTIINFYPLTYIRGKEVLFFFPYTSGNIARGVHLIQLSRSSKFLLWRSQEAGSSEENTCCWGPASWVRARS